MDIYKILGTSYSMYRKSIGVEHEKTMYYLQHTLAVLLNDDFGILAGSKGEGTNITPSDYHRSILQSVPSSFFSDTDQMILLYHMRVIEEGEALAQRFDNYIYCRAERGKHTIDGFRKLRIIHNPDSYSVCEDTAWRCAVTINRSTEDGYISSARFVAVLRLNTKRGPWKQSLHKDISVKGPSNVIEGDGSSNDCVHCFYVKTWPKEAESWYMRQTHWPDRQVKTGIKQIGYILVATGNNRSQESNLEWRCSFSIAEKILFQELTKSQRCTFIIFKVLLKEYLPSDIMSEKQLFSTYHMKTVFLWCLEDSKLKWEPGDIVRILCHLLDVLMNWINKEYFPHYFIPSVNLFDSRGLHGRKRSLQKRKRSLMNVISVIKNDLSKKIRQSQFFWSQEISASLAVDMNSELKLFIRCYRIINTLTILTQVQLTLHYKAYDRMYFNDVKFSHIRLLELLVSMSHGHNQEAGHLYRALYNDPVYDKLLTKVVPRLIDQYLGCIHLARYCMAERDGHIGPNTLHVAKSLLKDTLHLDPCSGYVKLACLYIATGDFVQAMDKLNIAESNFVYTHNRLRVSAHIASGIKGVDADRITTDFIHQVFCEWTEGQITNDIIVTWPEYITVPDLLQFELIHESTHQVIDIIHPSLKGTSGKMVGLDCQLQWPPLSMIKLLKFVCAFNTGRASTSHLENLVADLIASSLSTDVDVIYTVFNMAAWCYLKMKRYSLAAHMIAVAIVTRLDDDVNVETDIMKRFAFCHHVFNHVIAQCLYRSIDNNC